jgi:UDP-N-acetylmuramoyl-L-alanyl-D-glutamate--2,6-diaminopimelate ligase
MEKILRAGEKMMPKKLYRWGQPIYHYFLALLSAGIYGFPSRKIKVIGVTGTKGKSSTVEIVNAILEEAGHKTALSNTIRFKIGQESKNNKYKMSTPGRFFMQGFLRQAVSAGCEYAVVELTSQSVLQYRHKFIYPDAFVVTNVSPEHIESHGSYENYVEAKVDLIRQLDASHKRNRVLVVNADDKESGHFLTAVGEKVSKKTYSLKDAAPHEIKKDSLIFTFRGTSISSPLSGLFNLYNILAAATLAESLGAGISVDIIKRAIEKFSGIRGRVEKIDEGQDFTVVVDYAHTVDSLQKVYEVFQNSRKICVLGGTGGGRDRWKRKEMGKIANQHCDYIVLTNEDPYDESPMQIINDVAEGVVDETGKRRSDKLTVIIDRRAAIADALSHARTGDTVLITGKGTDPYIMGLQGKNIPWSDAEVAREELKKMNVFKK